MANQPKWLEDALFYEIYPQSYLDTNGDGIGDLPGILEKLDYIQGLGFNAIWINPCYLSPFGDAGYDVQDYQQIAPRYGTMADMEKLISEMHSRGMHLFLDLVPGHTSEEHKWFLKSSQKEPNEYSDRYIWTLPDTKQVFGLNKNRGTREGLYHYNFYPIQPSLNYGFAKVTQPWQTPAGAPAVKKTIEGIKDIIRFWLQKGVDGFRVDMAFSLVKDDGPGRPETVKVWQQIFPDINREFPQAAFVSEWGVPTESIPAGFAMDFYLQMNAQGFSKLFDFGDPEDLDATPFFDPRGKGDPKVFADEYTDFLAKTKGKGYICLITGNHDIFRRPKSLSPLDIKLAYAFIYTMPGIPFLYYGDEIGMRQQNGLDPVEGSMFRTGARTPMQWDAEKNAGFSASDADDLYLPIDPEENRPNVAQEEQDPDSILNFVKEIIALRKANPALGNTANFRILFAQENTYPLVYEREDGGQRLIVAVNPAAYACEAAIPYEVGEALYSLGGSAEAVPSETGCTLKMEGESFVIYKA